MGRFFNDRRAENCGKHALPYSPLQRVYVAAFDSCTNIKSVVILNTITTLEKESNMPLPGYRKLNPMVYCGLYPVDNAKYKDLSKSYKSITGFSSRGYFITF